MSGWSPKQMSSQAGRRVIVTGANSGIGLEAAKALAEQGASVVLACRDTAKGEAAAGRIAADVDVRALDLADLDSVRAFAAAWDEPLDLLVNNAGVMAPPLERTKQGFELQFGTNHLGHFALTGLLLPHLLAAESPRTVSLSSLFHRFGKMRWDDLNWEQGYSRWPAYGMSKLADLLFCFELQRRADATGSALTAVAAHPGYAATNLQRTMLPSILKPATTIANLVFAQSAEAGAWPTLFAATEPLAGAAYVGPGGPGESRGHPKLVGCSKSAQDAQAGARLWSRSSELTGVEYDFAVPAPA